MLFLGHHKIHSEADLRGDAPLKKVKCAILLLKFDFYVYLW